MSIPSVTPYFSNSVSTQVRHGSDVASCLTIVYQDTSELIRVSFRRRLHSLQAF